VGDPPGAFHSAQPTILPEMSNIHFAADAIHPVHSNGAAGGIYSTRSGNSNPPSIAEKDGAMHKAYVLDGKDEENGLKQEGDIKHKQVGTFSLLYT